MRPSPVFGGVHTRVMPLKPPPGMCDVAVPANGWERSHMRTPADLAETHSVSTHVPDLKDGDAGENRPREIFYFKQNNAGLHDLACFFFLL